MRDKKILILIISSIVLAVLIIIFVIIGIVKYVNRTIDVSDAKHSVTIVDNADFYKKTKLENVKIRKELPIGTNVYVLEDFTDEETGTAWSKVVIDNKIGYVLTSTLGYYKAEDDEKVLMVDLSKFNKEKNFDTAGEMAAFLINNKITYVYIRAGGRGYGAEGNFYTDPEFTLWADECEFLDIPFGIYFLDEALNSEEIDEEITFLEDFLKENKYKNNVLPIALDIEKHDGGRAEDIWEERADLVTELVQKMENKGLEPIIYSNANTASDYLSTVPAKFWLAYYIENTAQVPTYWYSEIEEQEPTQNEELMSKMIAWQFTETGVGRVVARQVDVSLIYKDFYK
jgi:hypothetical protein